ncbi:MAG TPA: glycosyltransferase family 4 protein [Solirubrobacteraceae bacterium]|nr:glycosyltransferase family 4 protein [Solirubrobacteraceae bacterium]
MTSPAHTFHQRAAELRRLLLPPRPPRDGLGLIVYPFDLNPYQEMLYGAIRASGVECAVVYVARRARLGPLPFIIQVAAARIRGYRLLHFHWPQFALHVGDHFLPRLSLLNARLSLWWLRALGVGLVWTVHNAVPHEPETSDDDAVTRMLARDAACKIVHSASAIEELAAMGADTERISVVPHGAYLESYSEASRPESRRRLQLPQDARIAMFFGQIRAYKGVDDLIPAWEEATGKTTGSGTVTPFLLIAGKCDDEADRRRLQRAVGEVGGRFDEGYAPHEKVPLYFAAADVVVLPFRQVTTSGSALLALSLGRPVVAPRVGALRDLPADVGFLYDDGELVSALGQALAAPQAQLDEYSDAARRYAASLSWDHIAVATLDVYRHAASRGR